MLDVVPLCCSFSGFISSPLSKSKGFRKTLFKLVYVCYNVIVSPLFALCVLCASQFLTPYGGCHCPLPCKISTASCQSLSHKTSTKFRHPRTYTALDTAEQVSVHCTSFDPSRAR